MRKLLSLGISLFFVSQFVASAAATPIVANGDFEAATTPALGGNQVQYTQTFGPITAVPGWTFGPSGGGSSYDGMSSGATFTNEGHGAFSGNQNAFVQGTGTISQVITLNPGSTYVFSVEAISRTNGGESTPEPTAVTINGVPLTFGGIPSFQAITSGWGLVTSDSFVAPAGSVTLAISGTVPLTVNDNLTGLDNVSVVPEPSSFILCGLGALGLFTVARRRRKA